MEQQENKNINLDTMSAEEVGLFLAEQYKLLIQTQNNIIVTENNLRDRKNKHVK